MIPLQTIMLLLLQRIIVARRRGQGTAGAIAAACGRVQSHWGRVPADRVLNQLLSITERAFSIIKGGLSGDHYSLDFLLIGTGNLNQSFLGPRINCNNCKSDYQIQLHLFGSCSQEPGYAT